MTHILTTSSSSSSNNNNNSSSDSCHFYVCVKVAAPPRKPTRDFGVGDGDVFALDMSLTSSFTSADLGPVRIHERELSTEQSTEVKEKEIKTVFLSGGPGDTATAVIGGGLALTKPTRSIGTL